MTMESTEQPVKTKDVGIGKRRLKMVLIPLLVLFVLTGAIILAVGLNTSASIERQNRTLRTVYRWLVVPELKRTVIYEMPWPGEATEVDRVHLSTPEPVEAGSYTELTLVYRAGPGGIKHGGALRVAFEHGADWGKLQVKNPEEDNFASVNGPDGTVWDLRTNYFLGHCTLVEATLKEGKVLEGDTVTFLLGDRLSGSPGFKAPTISEVYGAGRVRVFEDRAGEGGFYEVPGVPELEILPGPPYRLRLIARAWSLKGEPVDAVLQMNDRFGNVATFYNGAFRLYDAVTGEFLSEGIINQGLADLEGVVFPEEGVYRFRVEAEDYSAISNPIEVLASSDKPRTYFGSIHNHSIISDGLNTPEGTAAYARDISNFDFFSLSDHVSWTDWEYDPVLIRSDLDSSEWEDIAQVMRSFNEPGSFVTLLGFEWTTNAYGDKCFYFLDDTAPYREFPADQEGFYRGLEGERVTVITHTMLGVPGMRGPRWQFTNENLERVMEIASFHGIFEYGGNEYAISPGDKCPWSWVPDFVVRGNYAESVLRRGLRLGFVAGSDDHSGKPGAGVAGCLTYSIDGLTAYRDINLDRETLFNNIESRSVYATTGARILLDFTVNGRGMGEEFDLSPDSPRYIEVHVHGEAPVREVAVIREVPQEPVKVWTFDPPLLDTGLLEWTDMDSLTGSTWYYLRVKQEDHHLAWSSPVWIDLK